MKNIFIIFLIIFLYNKIYSNDINNIIKSIDIPKHLDIALNFVGITENPKNSNRGKEVEMFQKSVNIKKGTAWCGAFVYYCLSNANVKYPKIKSARAIDYITKNSKKANDILIGKKKVNVGDLIIFRYGSTVRGHIGIVIKWDNDKKYYGYTVEGNTTKTNLFLNNNMENSLREAEGDGVYLKIRSIQPANYFRIIYFTEVEY